MKIAYFDCFSGISGDMTIAAFLDAGLGMGALSAELAKLKIKGYRLKKHKVERNGIVGTKFDCVADHEIHRHRSLKEILALIGKSSLSKKVKETATGIFTAIGQAEKKIHGVRPGNDVRLEELGSVDSIIDIVGVAIAVDKLGIDEVRASRISLGRTFVKTGHGNLPIPAPATIELLKGIPISVSEIEAELVTPTGAGILKTLSKGFGRMPEMKVLSVGYGAGTRVLADRPNMLRLLIGEAGSRFKEDMVSVIETNIDDMPPNYLEYVFEKLFEKGALDVYTTAIQMKKSRPAFKLTVLARTSGVEEMAGIIFNETTAIGLRFYEAGRFKLEREIVRARTRYGNVNVKVSRSAGGIFTASPEYDECAKIARKKKVPLKAVYDEAKKTVGKRA